MNPKRFKKSIHVVMSAKPLLLIFSVLIINAAMAQSQNKLDSVGNVGVGTITPTCELDVVGETSLDGKVTVKDSLQVDKVLIVEQDVIFKGRLKLVDEGVFQNKITVNDKASFNDQVVVNDLGKFNDDIKVFGTTKMKGDAFVEGSFKLKGLADSLATEPAFLMINSNGKVLRSFTFGTLLEDFYGTPCRTDQFGNTIPIWSTGGNKLFAGDPCSIKVGINTNNPIKEIDVRGDGYISGKLSIGTTDIATNYLLSVDGGIMAEEVRVMLHPWPDYVFDIDYQLMDIKLLGEFIKCNGHLPNVPTAEVIEEEGLDLGEANRILMEKIEELTLYILMQNERIESLEMQMQELIKN